MREDQPGDSPRATGAEELAFFNATAQSQQEMHRMNLGWVGRFLGGGPEKAGNIAALTIAAAILLLAVVAIRIDWTKELDTFLKVLSGVLSVVTLSLGYLFGVHHSGQGPPGPTS